LAGALSQVAQRPVLSDMARHLEASPTNNGPHGGLLCPATQQLEAAGRGAIDTLGPATANPSMIGPQAGAAARRFSIGCAGHQCRNAPEL
jgi:hypothetical protein